MFQKNNLRKMWMYLIIFILLLAIIIVVYRISNNVSSSGVNNRMPVSADNTESWNTYTNLANRYTLKYPSEISYEELSNSDVRFYLTSDGKNNKTPTGLKDNLEIVIRTGTSAKNAAISELSETPEGEVTLNNAVGVKMKPNDNFPLNYYIQPIRNNGPILRIIQGIDYSNMNPTKNENTSEVFKKMVATFKFF